MKALHKPFIIVTIENCQVTTASAFIEANEHNFPEFLEGLLCCFEQEDFKELRISLGGCTTLVCPGTLEPPFVSYMQGLEEEYKKTPIGPYDIDSDLRAILFPENEEDVTKIEGAQELPGGGYIL